MSEPSIPKRATRKKKMKAPRAAFVVTIAAAVGVASACGTVVGGTDECPAEQPASGEACARDLACSYDGSGCVIDFECGEDGTWLDVSPPCNPPPPEGCPEPFDQATTEQPCFEDGLLCEGPDYGCGPSEFRCIEEVWEEWSFPCNPPAPCPVELPIEGEVCPSDLGGTPVGCTYEVVTACGPTQIEADCVASDMVLDVWAFIAPPCEPKMPNCEGYTSIALCQSDLSCRWLIPGCAEPPSDFATGCYPAADCDAESCPLDQACGTVVFDPCFDSECNACGADAQICLPSDAPE